MDRDPNCISYWLPRLMAAGVPVPRTQLLNTDIALDELLDGKEPEGWAAFLTDLRRLVDDAGRPCFLRTGHTSDKHGWLSTCYLDDPGALESHVYRLVESSAIASIVGLPTNVWAVRRFLRLEHGFSAWHGMPVAREFRAFFVGGRKGPECIHPYWPRAAIRDASVPEWARILDEQSKLDGEAEEAIFRIVAQASDHFEGGWSIDCARAEHGTWYAIDMAVADQSFHWPGCPHAGRTQGDPNR